MITKEKVLTISNFKKFSTLGIILLLAPTIHAGNRGTRRTTWGIFHHSKKAPPNKKRKFKKNTKKVKGSKKTCCRQKNHRPRRGYKRHR